MRAGARGGRLHSNSDAALPIPETLEFRTTPRLTRPARSLTIIPKLLRTGFSHRKDVTVPGSGKMRNQPRLTNPPICSQAKSSSSTDAEARKVAKY